MEGFLYEFKASIMKSLNSWLRRGKAVLAMFIADPVWFILFSIPMMLFGGDRQYTYNLGFWGWYSFMLISNGLWTLGGYMREEIIEGTFEYTLLTNSNRLMLFIGYGLIVLFESIISLFIMIVIIKLIFGIEVMIINPVMLTIVIVIGYLSVLSLGLLYSALIHMTKASMIITNVVQFIIPLISGVFIPLASMPSPLREIALTMPFSYMSELMRYAAMSHPTFLNPMFEFLLLILITIAYFNISMFLFKKYEDYSKKRGILIRSW